MARLHEYHGKSLLADRGLPIPKGHVATTPAQARDAAANIGARTVLKIQAWTTGRAALGGVSFADSPEEAEIAAERLLKMSIGAFPVEQILVEEALPIKDEIFVSMTIDDAARAPLMLLSFTGGTGIEDRDNEVHQIPVNVDGTINNASIKPMLEASDINPSLHNDVIEAIATIARTAKEVEARSFEVNPLVTTTDGKVLAADCRVTIDDYAVFRHPELGIDIARELDHPPTELERIAYRIEQADHRGTFYFAVLPVSKDQTSTAAAFHGAGGGGSMMSMDALSKAGFTPANFTDTSGNPSAAKVYAAARVILSQNNLVGYFGSGSGVASQEQHHSAYGLAKAFLELNLSIPAVIRLGGNSEDRAVDILESACNKLPATIEGYKKDDSPAIVADRFAALVKENNHRAWTPTQRTVPDFVNDSSSYTFPISFGTDKGPAVWIDHAACTPEITAIIIKNSAGILKEQGGLPVLAITPEDAATMDSEMIACEIECRRAGAPVVFVDLPIAGLDTASSEGVN